jgi:hypothetical protein
MKKKLMLFGVMALVLSLTLPMGSVFAANGDGVGLFIKVKPAPREMNGYDWLEEVGRVQVNEDGLGNLVVRYVPDPDWVITETHLWVGEAPPFAYPQTRNGNPRPGKFPYKGEYDPPVAYPEEVVYTIPLSDFNYPSVDLAILAQAVVRPAAGGRQETAWGDCNPLPDVGDTGLPPPRWAKCFYFEQPDSGG